MVRSPTWLPRKWRGAPDRSSIRLSWKPFWPQHTSEESIMVRRARRSENDQLTGLKTGSSVTKGFAEGVRRGETHPEAVSYTHLRAHETRHDLVCRLLLEKKKTKNQ